MVKRFLIFPLLVLLGYGLISNSDFATIAAGVAIFIVGMLFMEDGFRLFTGGTLAQILKKTTGTLPRSIFSGFLSTAIVQSSSLTSVIAISFVTAELINLSQAIGIVFGANIGTTATAWIVAAFGMKIKISAYAMPILVFGVLFTFTKKQTYRGIGNILLGLGFIFLGISFMKDGFETLKNGIDLSQFAVSGLLGIGVYVFLGAIATVIIQSSSATMALIITAVATGQIEYVNSLSLAIGANIGTTVTAVLGSLTSNANGKRLAVAHLIFNIVTALFAILFLPLLQQLVIKISSVVGIGDDDIAMQLSLFHTIFNVSGVLIVTPFMGKLVGYLETLFIFKGDRRGKPIYLDHEVIKTPGPALTALAKETMHLYDIVTNTILKAVGISREEILSEVEWRRIVEKAPRGDVDVDEIYEGRIKKLYSTILQHAVLAESNMNKKQRKQVYKIKLASREIVEAVKDIRELQKNIGKYLQSDNTAIKGEYNFLRANLGEVLRRVEDIRRSPYDYDLLGLVEVAREKNKNLDRVASNRLSRLLRDGEITENMASSLMNDSSYTRMIAKNLLKSAAILWAGEMETEITPDTPAAPAVGEI
ncbi:Na/Pi cotransporter family protein [Desulfopila sp. IMCC35008]|uniref:Na/Pi cotransporter family protein n=1 Tax=Desulfopila sp. IMCC35008 TaxID=2653858 RepID=UPI0013D87717|nr:Na/Pi cotransporter family protein [Desulfopila sp. IMCC35008]